MNILCDTCSVLMLIRISPDMFIDKRFNCATIKEVRKEIFQTQKFKSKYPWRNQFKDKIIADFSISDKPEDFNSKFILIRQLMDACIINRRTQRSFDLSLYDQKIAAYCVTYNLVASSTDKDLIVFLSQEFEIENKYPLTILNEWLKNNLIVWSPNLQSIIEDWDVCYEPIQPNEDKIEFEKITGFKYTGP